MHHLYVLSKTKFAVKSSLLKKPYFFETIEGAAEALLELGVKDDDIDTAIMDMYSRENNHARFEAIEGKFDVSTFVENLSEESI